MKFNPNILHKWGIQAVVIAFAFSMSGCHQKQEKLPPPTVRVVSWGGKFQNDLVKDWLQPAADRANIHLEAEAWDGDYGSLTSRIEKGVTTWDLVHVEAHYVRNPKSTTLFASFPGRDLSYLMSSLKDSLAVPVLEYGYLLAYRKDQLTLNSVPTWKDFFDTRRFAGRRGARDFPIGNIEIALISMGRDLNKDLYDPALPLSTVEQNVVLALERWNEIRRNVIWWKTGDQLQSGMTSGELSMCAAWSGRVLSAYRELNCGGKPLKDCVLKVNASSALVSTDWWVIPKGAPNADIANRLLEAMYGSAESIRGASDFSLAQGYRVPSDSVVVKDTVASYFLNLGSSANKNMISRINEEFWSKNFDWISDRWTSWRLQR